MPESCGEWRRHGLLNSQVIIEVRESDDWTLAIPVRPEHALDAFHHPNAYTGSRGLRDLAGEQFEP
jgi:hypothetical protein